LILLLLLLSVSGSLKLATQASESVDLIELNHYYDTRGRLIYDQVVFWEINPTNKRFQVRAWCLVDDREDLDRRPIKNESTGRWSVVWRDGDKRVMRHITSQQYRESWTQTDPERDDKKRHDERLRVALVAPIREVGE